MNRKYLVNLNLKTFCDDIISITRKHFKKVENDLSFAFWW